MTQFKVGDRVRLNEDNGGYGAIGSLGTVLQSTGENVCVVRFDEKFGESQTTAWAVYNYKLSLVITPGTRVTARGGEIAGVVVAEVPTVSVLWDNTGNTNNWPVADLAVEDAKPPKTRGQIIQALRKAAGLPEFMMGDVVNWTHTRDSWQECEVVGFPPGCVAVRWGGTEGYIQLKEVELVTPATSTPAIAPQSPALLLKIGDYVRAEGRVGQIDDVDADDDLLPYLVTWLDEYEGDWFGTDEVEKWSPRVGDRVEMKNAYCEIDKGMTGVVYERGVDDDGEEYDIDVIFDTLTSGHDGEAHDDSENHYYVPAESLAPSATAAPVVAPATVEFKRGDIVEVVGKEYCCAPIGTTAIVYNIDEEGDFDILVFDQSNQPGDNIYKQIAHASDIKLAA